MRKRLASLLPAWLVIVLFMLITAASLLAPSGVEASQAKASRPAAPMSTNCYTTVCSNSLTWPGNVYGGQWTVAVSEPPFDVAGEYWHRRWLLSDTQEGKTEFIEIGMEEIADGDTRNCGHNTSGHSELFYQSDVHTIDGKFSGYQCDHVPSADVNHDTRFLLSTQSRDVNGTQMCLLAWFHNFISNTDFQNWYSCVGYATDTEYDTTSTSETIRAYIDTDEHIIWGTDMNENSWQTGDYAWHFQTVPYYDPNSTKFMHCGGNGCPSGGQNHTPFWYWFVYPGDPNNSQGGQMLSCSYDTYPGSFCTIGS